jgi:hypothetical protein
MPAPALGPQAAAITTVVERVAAMPPGDVAVLVAAVNSARVDSGSWARAMHEASWAVELSGRRRAAAAAQMLLVGAVHGSVPARELARGAWNLLSGVVHAVAVEDLLEAGAFDVLVPAAARVLSLR